jgi:hypothetical protein
MALALSAAPSHAPAMSLPSALPSASAAEPKPDPALLAAIARTSDELVGLRDAVLDAGASASDGCARFQSVSLAAAKALRAPQNLGSASNECSAEALTKVHCLETPAGYFVPVADRGSL